MPEQDYEYRGLVAETWDLFRGDTSNWEDKEFYQNIIEQHGQPVLDVGCGTGRLVLDYLAGGLDVDGVDNSPEMLAICLKKGEQLGLNPNLFAQWMERLALPRKYRTIIVPSSSFQLVTEAPMAAQAMQRFYAHLEPEGVLVMPFTIFWEPGDPTELDWKLIAEETRPADGAVVRRWATATFDVERQLQHTQDRYQITLNGKVIAAESHRRSPALRWYTQRQAVKLYQEAGFSGINLFGGFTTESAAATDTVFTVLGVK